ncbi:MAG: hypothetical protein [Wufeng shrew rhabdovirus 8]|nr:MAG: hypothetical protein [Wufeng shrew rhabdovirus 8]
MKRKKQEPPEEIELHSMSGKSLEVYQDTGIKSQPIPESQDTSSLIKSLLAHKYDAWLGILTFLLIIVYIAMFWLLCPCCKALKRYINTEVKITSDKLTKKIEKLEARRQAKQDSGPVYVPLNETKY